ncbi:hypothetical protein ILYODFUR_037051 [Ilyodon furcidens]|uniref:Uncharacterized protein n=1 Tax=Ilyodon furcidens TaxID=33524 RepID=A0ABV0VK89_9TELE
MSARYLCESGNLTVVYSSSVSDEHVPKSLFLSSRSESTGEQAQDLKSPVSPCHHQAGPLELLSSPLLSEHLPVHPPMPHAWLQPHCSEDHREPQRERLNTS